jgi:hypothetical protein
LVPFPANLKKNDDVDVEDVLAPAGEENWDYFQEG